MVDVTDPGTTDGDFNGAQFSFAGNEGEPSPFAYVPSAGENRCGVSKSGNQNRIEVLGCAKPILLSFITGFVHSAAALDIASLIFLDESAFAGYALPTFDKMISALQISSSSPQYIYQANAADTIVGPTIVFDTGVDAADVVKKIQLSMVFIGLKTFTAATYPQNIPESFIVAVGGIGYSGAAPPAAGALTAVILVDAYKTAGAAVLDLQTYNGATLTNMGH